MIYYYSEQCDVTGRNYSSLQDFLGDFKVNEMTTCAGLSTAINTNMFLGFCRGSASASRGFVSAEFGADTYNNESVCENSTTVVDSGKQTPMLGEQCDSLPHL